MNGPDPAVLARLEQTRVLLVAARAELLRAYFNAREAYLALPEVAWVGADRERFGADLGNIQLLVNRADVTLGNQAKEYARIGWDHQYGQR